MTVACVLRSGGDFSPSWVTALREGVREHLTLSHRFLCLTDMEIDTDAVVVPLAYGWPGWWSKMELFSLRACTGPVLYLDLDTLPVGSLNDFASYSGDLAMLSDFYRPRKAQSGVMLFWPSDYTAAIWRDWCADPKGHMHRFRGDGEWLDRHTRPERVQELYPGRIVSLKVHAKDGPPEGAALVAGHGKPRLSDPKAGWAHELWKERANDAV